MYYKYKSVHVFKKQSISLNFFRTHDENKLITWDAFIHFFYKNVLIGYRRFYVKN